MSATILIFDLDGTLVDSVPDLTWALNQVLGERGYKPLTSAEVSPMVGDGVPALVERGFAARGGVEHLLETLVDHVAVALHGDDQRAGLGSLHTRGERRRAPVQRLQHLDVEVVGERGVAADPEHADGTLRGADLLDRLEHGAHRDRFAAAGAEAVLAHVEVAQ